MNNKSSYVYILSNSKQNVFYIGVTSDLPKRMFRHLNKEVDGFTSRYNITKLLYYEIYNEIEKAIAREKKIKHWKKEWKWNIIDSVNKDRTNLYKDGAILPLDYALVLSQYFK